MEMKSEHAGGRSFSVQGKESLRTYVKSGQPWVWLTAAAIAVCFIITTSLLCLMAARGLPHFWPAKLLQADYQRPGEKPAPLLAEVLDSEEVSSARLKGAGYPVNTTQAFYHRVLVKVGNRDLNGADFQFLLDDWIVNRAYPLESAVFERMEWGNFHGTVIALKQNGEVKATGQNVWDLYP